VQYEVDFNDGRFYSVHQYLIPYLLAHGAHDISKNSRIDGDNVTTFLRKYVKAKFIQEGWLEMQKNKACLNARGWEEFFKVARTVVDGSEVRLRKK
jgi:predicted ATPase with chaperone activity